MARNERDFLSPFAPPYCVSTGASRAIHLSYGEKRAPQRGSGKKKKRKRKKARGGKKGSKKSASTADVRDDVKSFGSSRACFCSLFSFPRIIEYARRA